MYTFSIKKTEMISVPIKVNSNNIDTIFGFLYFYAGCDGETEPNLEYISIGGTFVSADGEYRTNFYPHQDLVDKIKHVQNIIDDIKDTLNEKIELTFDIILPKYTSEKNNSKIIKLISKVIKQNILIYYCFCWLTLVYKYKYKIIENHTNQKLIKIFFDNKKTFNIVAKKYDIKKINIEINYRTSRIDSTIRCGQKIIPTTITEINNFYNIKESLWREIFIKNKINNLVFNGIINNVSFFIGWFIINTNSNIIYDNEVSHLKILYSSYIKNEIKKVHKIKCDINKLEQNNILILNKIRNLQKTISIPITYAEQYIILSKISICLIDLWRGSPLADLPNYVKTEQKEISISTSYIFKDVRRFNFICFKIFYTLFIFNKFYNIIHGDLHMNNILLMPIRGFKVREESEEPKESTSYQIFNLNEDNNNDGENIFIMGYDYFTPYIIDFSRALIYKSDNIDNDLITNELKDIYKKNMLCNFKQELPEFYNDNKVHILFCVYEQFQKFYRIFYAFDAYKFSKGFLNILENIKNEPKFDQQYIENAYIHLMKKINSFTIKFIKKYVYLLYENNNTIIPNINKLIIKHFFSDYNLTNTKKITTGKIKDVFNCNNKIVNDISENFKTIDIYKKSSLKKLGMTQYFTNMTRSKNEHEHYLKTCDYKKKIESIKENNIY